VPKNDITMTKTRKVELIRDEIKLEESRREGKVRSESPPASPRSSSPSHGPEF